MLTYCTYAESGGTYKTTTAVNLARAHVDQGLDVLVVDLDHQKGNLSHLLGVADDQANDQADHLPRHLINRGRGPLSDLIRTTAEGIDVIPAHNKLEDLPDDIRRHIEMAESMGETVNEYGLLLDALQRGGVPDAYDVLIVDPNARAEISLYNALYATRNVVAPVEFGGKGSLSVDGLEELGGAFADNQGIDIGVLAVVPTAVKDTKAQRRRRADIEEKDFPVPVTIGVRGALGKAMWEAQGSAFRVIEEAWDLVEREDGADEYEPGVRDVPDRERETLANYRELADHVAGQSDLSFEPVADAAAEEVRA